MKIYPFVDREYENEEMDVILNGRFLDFQFVSYPDPAAKGTVSLSFVQAVALRELISKYIEEQWESMV